jgi:predicted FMN-binding regulatory protein PaiB
MKFQSMYEQKDPAQLAALQRRTRMGLLLVQAPDGGPRAGWTNASPAGPGFMVHLASDDPQAAALRAGSGATLLFSEVLSTIPSHWVDPEDGSRATNLYLAVEYRCAVQVLDTGPRAASALASMLIHYQPEGGHRSMDPEDPLYAAKLKALCVAHLNVVERRSKWKVGQVWSPEKRLEIMEKLTKRGRPEDLRSGEEMRRWFGDQAAGVKNPLQ